MNNGSTSPHALAARQAKRQAAAEVGIDDQFVSDLVDRFYERVRGDESLGPIFEEHVDDWPVHLGQMKRFWRSVLFSSGEFLGSPMAKHMAIPGLDRTLFVRWLELFATTLDELGSAEAREHVHENATRIANSLLNGILIQREGGFGLRADEVLT